MTKLSFFLSSLRWRERQNSSLINAPWMYSLHRNWTLKVNPNAWVQPCPPQPARRLPALFLQQGCHAWPFQHSDPEPVQDNIQRYTCQSITILSVYLRPRRGRRGSWLSCCRFNLITDLVQVWRLFYTLWFCDTSDWSAPFFHSSGDRIWSPITCSEQLLSRMNNEKGEKKWPEKLMHHEGALFIIKPSCIYKKKSHEGWPISCSKLL